MLFVTFCIQSLLLTTDSSRPTLKRMVESYLSIRHILTYRRVCKKIFNELTYLGSICNAIVFGWYFGTSPFKLYIYKQRFHAGMHEVVWVLFG